MPTILRRERFLAGHPAHIQAFLGYKLLKEILVDLLEMDDLLIAAADIVANQQFGKLNSIDQAARGA